MAIVVPFIANEIPLIEENFSLWNRFPPCAHNSAASNHIDLIFYFNQDWARTSGTIARLKGLFKGSVAKRCFREIKFLMANLPAHTEQDQYPLGSSLMFFKAWEMPALLDSYTFMFWMEADLRPCRPGWLDQVYRAAILSEGAWMIGSITRDGQQSNTYSSFADHINGNALYRLDDVAFQTFLARVQEEFIKNKGRFLASFDIAIYLVARYTLPFEEYAASKHRFQYTNLWQNLYRSKSFAQKVCSEETDTFLLHGRNIIF